MATIDDIRAKFKGAGFDAHVATKLAEAFALVLANSGALTVKEGGSTVSSAVTALDFGAGFDVTESPSGEANVFLNAAEAWDILANGTTPAAGKVPVYQADGTVAWETPSGGGGSSSVPLTLDHAFSEVETNSSFSADLRTVTTLGGSVGMIPSSRSFGGDGGRWYFEAEIVDAGTGSSSSDKASVGVETRWSLYRASRSSWLGAGVGAFAYWNSGKFYSGSVAVTTPSQFDSGDIVGVAIDSSTGEIWFAKNNTWQGGDPAAGTGAAYTNDRLKLQLHASVNPYVTGASLRLRVSSENSFAPPAGFNAAFD
jgi:hypothetical protein